MSGRSAGTDYNILQVSHKLPTSVASHGEDLSEMAPTVGIMVLHNLRTLDVFAAFILIL